MLAKSNKGETKENMKDNEMVILKSCSMKLDAETAFIAAFLYHSTKGDRSKSEYVYKCRVEKIAKLQAEADAMKADGKKLGEWTWPGWTGKVISYSGDATAGKGGKWLSDRIKKLVEFDAGQKLLAGYKPSKDVTDPAIAYDLAGLVDEAGNVVDASSKDALLKCIGQTLTKVNKKQ